MIAKHIINGFMKYYSKLNYCTIMIILIMIFMLEILLFLKMATHHILNMHKKWFPHITAEYKRMHFLGKPTDIYDLLALTFISNHKDENIRLNKLLGNKKCPINTDAYSYQNRYRQNNVGIMQRNSARKGKWF